MKLHKIRERKGKTLTKNWRELWWKGTNKHIETYSKYFNGHRSLSQSEENKCMWTHGKDGIKREFLKGATRVPVGTYVYSITCPLILITSPVAILNLPINSFCSLDTVLVLTSDDFHSIFLPSLHSSPLSCLAIPLVALFKISHMMPSLPCVHIHLLSSDRERHLWSSKCFH